MNLSKIIYWIATAAMCGVFLFSAHMYLTKYEMVTGFYKALGFPVWMIYPLAILKILGVVAILTKLSPTLKEWAYAGFLFDAAWAMGAHYVAGHGITPHASIALIAILVSRYLDGKLYGSGY